MTNLFELVLFTTLAGATMPLGGLLACVERIQPLWLEREFRHSVVAFGGGILLAAVSLVLIPEGVKELPMFLVIVAMVSGGLSFLWLDRAIRSAGTAASQFAAMLSDFLPEALAMGAAFATGQTTGLVLAFLIASQNLPEGFNAFREMATGSKRSKSRTLWLFILAVPAGPICGLAGYFWLADLPRVVGFIMLFAAGGILYLTFQDIAPQSKLERHWAPAMGSVLGFLLGVCGQLLIA